MIKAAFVSLLWNKKGKINNITERIIISIGAGFIWIRFVIPSLTFSIALNLLAQHKKYADTTTEHKAEMILVILRVLLSVITIIMLIA